MDLISTGFYTGMDSEVGLSQMVDTESTLSEGAGRYVLVGHDNHMHLR